MKRSVYVGNLPDEISEERLRELFEPYGVVHAVSMITDRVSGKPRGFAFVEMDDEAIAQAVDALDGSELGGHNLRVSQARPRTRWPMRRRPGPGGRSRSRRDL